MGVRGGARKRKKARGAEKRDHIRGGRGQFGPKERGRTGDWRGKRLDKEA